MRTEHLPLRQEQFPNYPRKNLKLFRPTYIEELHLLLNQEKLLPPDLRECISPLIDYRWDAQQGYDGFHIETSDTLLSEFWENEKKIRLSSHKKLLLCNYQAALLLDQLSKGIILFICSEEQTPVLHILQNAHSYVLQDCSLPYLLMNVLFLLFLVGRKYARQYKFLAIRY